MFFSAARRGFRGRIASPESRQAPGSLVADKPSERLPDQSSLLFDTGVLFGLPDQFVVEGNGGTHGNLNMQILASFRCCLECLAVDTLPWHPILWPDSHETRLTETA